MAQMISKTCMFCNTTHEFKVRSMDVERLNSGEHIQNCMPYLSAGERELLISGICEPCFDSTFDDEEDDIDE